MISSIRPIIQSISWSLSSIPASIAGLIFSVVWIRQKLYHTAKRCIAASCLAIFFLKALVLRVNLQFAMRIVRLCRSRYDVLWSVSSPFLSWER